MAATDVPGSVPIWARPEPGARRPRFSREQIATAAIDIADADGFEAVTMRRIAAALGAGTMSLYRYIETKDDLLALIEDAIRGEALVTGELPADWKQALMLIARQTMQAYQRHPWAVRALSGATAAATPGPNRLRQLDQCLAAVAAAPLSQRAKLDLLGILNEFGYGHLLRLAELSDQAAAPPGRDGLAGSPGFQLGQLGSDEYPHLTALAADGAALLAGDSADREARFDLGLRLIIEGAAAGLLGGPEEAAD